MPLAVDSESGSLILQVLYAIGFHLSHFSHWLLLFFLFRTMLTSTNIVVLYIRRSSTFLSSKLELKAKVKLVKVPTSFTLYYPSGDYFIYYFCLSYNKTLTIAE